ncbi:MAG: L-serine ammonia-lyase, iron-sulfur-dependent, subunit alpha [Bacillaceae bacterium]
MFRNVKELLQLAEERECPISELMIEHEMNVTGLSKEEVIARMENNLQIMTQSVEKGFKGVKSYTGLTGGDGKLLHDYIQAGKGISGDIILLAVAGAVATNEVNAAMGLVCATPTAGSAGTVPGVLFGVKDKLNLTKDQMIRFLFTAGAFGLIVANNASISGAAGGCQAEVGTASGMAAAALVEAAGGTPTQAAEAMSIALKNMLGLVCDPVAGLVEVPCVKRNAAGASNAMIAADMALAGVSSKIPCDEVIDAMYRVGNTMPEALRETAKGGLAATKTGRRLQEEIFGKKS